MKPYNIKVTAVYPGAVYTSSWKDAGISPKELWKQMIFRK